MNKQLSILFTVVIIFTLAVSIAAGCSSDPELIEAAAEMAHHSATENPEATTEPAETAISDASEAVAEPTESPSSRVLLINNGTYGDAYFYKNYDVSETVIEYADESKAGLEKTVEFLGKRYELVYNSTVTYVVGNITGDVYYIKGGEYELYGNVHQSKVVLLPDDTLVMFLAPTPLSVDLNECKNMEDVRIAAEEALSGEIDFGELEISHAWEDTSSSISEYFFEYHRSLSNGIWKDGLVRIYIVDGNIRHLRMLNRADYGLDDVSDDLNWEDYIPAIEEKLNELFGESLEDYEIDRDKIILTNIGGSPCIDFTLHVDVTGSVGGFVGGQCELAVVIESRD